MSVKLSLENILLLQGHQSRHFRVLLDRGGGRLGRKEVDREGLLSLNKPMELYVPEPRGANRRLVSEMKAGSVFLNSGYYFALNRSLPLTDGHCPPLSLLFLPTVNRGGSPRQYKGASAGEKSDEGIGFDSVIRLDSIELVLSFAVKCNQ